MTSNRPPSRDQSDSRFEERLRGFRPATPRALAIPRRAPWAPMAVAAVVFLTAAASFIKLRNPHVTVQHPFAPPITIGTLNAALRDNEETLNRLLDDASPRILPHSQHGSVLFELGKE